MAIIMKWRQTLRRWPSLWCWFPSIKQYSNSAEGSSKLCISILALSICLTSQILFYFVFCDVCRCTSREKSAIFCLIETGYGIYFLSGSINIFTHTHPLRYRTIILIIHCHLVWIIKESEIVWHILWVWCVCEQCSLNTCWLRLH